MRNKKYMESRIRSGSGLPTFAIGASRVKKVTNFLSPKFNTALIDIFPGSQYNYQSKNIQPGITFRIRF